VYGKREHSARCNQHQEGVPANCQRTCRQTEKGWRTNLQQNERAGQRKTCGFPAVDFGLHSLKAGGATAAAVAGVQDRLFKKHGRWKSENAKDGYIEDSLQQRLSVTKNLGL